ncbi:MAG TPA: phosphatidylglycerophosphatase A [Clostridia bacterium]|nr:phosphatidylglycerophosphatase A [Clostridia bacterium]
MKDLVIQKLKERGVSIEKVAEIVYELQSEYFPNLTFESCCEAVHVVLKKREVQYALLTGLALDTLAEEGILPEPLLGIVQNDEPLYGIDEVIALAITNVYGSIGLTSFGYLDKTKHGIIGELNDGKYEYVNTFADDLVAAVAAAACARIAHSSVGSVENED